MIRTLLAAAACICMAAVMNPARAANAPAPGAAEPPSRAVSHFSGPSHMAGPVLQRRSILIGTADHHSQWRDRAGLMREDVAALQTCMDDAGRCADKTTKRWADLVRMAQAMPALDRIAFVNRRINALISYRHDYDRYRQRDYWASPRQALGRAGDCEDYALAKYWTLRALGFPSDRLRLVVLKNTRRNAYHAVLQVTYAGDEILLDNLSNALRGPQDLAHYRPLYSVNEHWKWIHPKAIQPRPVAALNGVIHWEYGSS